MDTKSADDFGEVILYRSDDGTTAVDVRLAGETAWLTLDQIAALFARDKSVISRHLKNVFDSQELDRDSVVAKNATTAADGKVYQVEYFNLDAIISVGYRVNSKRGTQFRVWATGTLKQHLIRGYTLNERRLRERGLAEAEQAVQLLSRTLARHELVNDQGRGVLEVVSRYAKTWLLLGAYDEKRLEPPKRARRARAVLDAERAYPAIASLKARLVDQGEATDLFGRERADGLRAILGAIEQTFDRKPLYPSIEARAAHLLYFIIKDHPFTDGNKRIGAFLFILYLRENRYLTDARGELKLNDNALVALALLTAESEPGNKELMIRLIMHLLTDERRR